MPEPHRRRHGLRFTREFMAMPVLIVRGCLQICCDGRHRAEARVMAQWHGISRRKPSGGRRASSRKKRRNEIASEKQDANIGKGENKHYRIRGNNKRVRVLNARNINVSNPKDGSTQQAALRTVVESPANPNYIRRNILTKGSVVDTDIGQVLITSRPGQDGVVNGVQV